MSEANARTFLTITGVFAVICYIIAIALGLQGYRLVALIVLIVALFDTIAAMAVYRIYTRLRGVRWQDELRASEEKMQQMLAEESQKMERK